MPKTDREKKACRRNHGEPFLYGNIYTKAAVAVTRRGKGSTGKYTLIQDPACPEERSMK